MLLGQELKFKYKLCNLKLGTFFSAFPGLGASALSGRAAPTLLLPFPFVVTVGSERAPLEHIIKLKVQCKKKIVSTLSKNDGLIRCAIYNMAGNLCQHPGDRKRKSPRLQNRYRSEIWGKSRKNIPLRHFRRMRQMEFGGKEKGANLSECPSLSVSSVEKLFSLRQIDNHYSTEKIILQATSYNPQHLPPRQHQHALR